MHKNLTKKKMLKNYLFRGPHVGEGTTNATNI